MPNFGELINKVKQMAGQHPDQVAKGLDKVEDLVDQKTGGKYGDQIHKGGDAAEKYLTGGQQQGGPGQGGQQGYDQNQR